MLGPSAPPPATVRRRRRSGARASRATPWRCASLASLDSSACDSTSSSSSLDDGGDASASGAAPLHAPPPLATRPSSLRRALAFDPFCGASTAWRNEKMLAAASPGDGRGGDAARVRHCGQDVCFLPRRFHYTAAELAPHRGVGDPEMDALLDSDSGVGGTGAFDDVVARAAEEHRQGRSTPSSRWYAHYHDVPAWADFDQIQRGIEVFLAYLPAAGCALFYRSLVGGFSIPPIVAVLRATRYLVPAGGGADAASEAAAAAARGRRRSRERLLDTGGFLACCVAPPPPSPAGAASAPAAAALRPGGRGWRAALRVRALHAKVRRRLRASGDWDLERDGVPINQEDMAATLLAFSANVLLGIEIVAGRPLPAAEQRDYLALWRYLGWLLGVDTPEAEEGGSIRSSNPRSHNPLVPIDPCGFGKRQSSVVCDRGQGGGPDRDATERDPLHDSIVHSYATLESVILHLLHPEDSSRELVTHLLSLRGGFLFRAAVCRRFLGGPLADDLGLPDPSAARAPRRARGEVLRRAAAALGAHLFLLFLRGYTRLSAASPGLRRRAVTWHARLEGRFLALWEEGNARRVAAAATEAGPPRRGPPRDGDSRCPFSMVMPPHSAAS